MTLLESEKTWSTQGYEEPEACQGKRGCVTETESMTDEAKKRRKKSFRRRFLRDREDNPGDLFVRDLGPSVIDWGGDLWGQFAGLLRTVVVSQ